MKKTLVLFLSMLMVAMALVSCGNSEDKEPENTIDPLANSVKTEAPATSAETPESTEPPKKEAPNPEDYDFIHVFKAPEGNPRDIVLNYMLDMAKVKWVATETWTTTWKEQGDFTVNLTYEKGKTYYGIPYSNTKGTLDEFSLFIEDGTFTPNSPYYEELIGNHCSSSMVMAFQQILDFTFSGSLKPATSRIGLLKFPDGIEIPPSRTEGSPNDWISETVFAHNGQDAILNGYAQLDKGDILYKNIDGSGHTRMVSKVEIFKTAAGKLMPSRSFVYCVEQTNAWFTSEKNSTWFIDKKYSFSTLHDTFFMPVTFEIYHDEDAVIEDAYIMMDGKNTPETITKMLTGTVESTFPLAYVRATIKDANGNIVGEQLEYDLGSTYKVNLRNMHYGLGIDKLPAGTYTYNLRAGIARGGVDIETFEFTIA